MSSILHLQQLAPTLNTADFNLMLASSFSISALCGQGFADDGTQQFQLV